jgi:hypothetical protein
MTRQEEVEYFAKGLGVDLDAAPKKIRAIYLSTDNQERYMFDSWDCVEDFRKDTLREDFQLFLSVCEVIRITLIDRDTLEEVSVFYTSKE